HGKKRPCESNNSSSTSFTTQNHPSSSLPLDAIVDENDDESFRSNSSSPSQIISSSSNVVHRVRQNLPHESHDLNTYLSKTINFQTQQRDAYRNGLRSIGQAIKDMMSGKRNKIRWSKKDNVLLRGIAWTNISKFEKSNYNHLFGSRIAKHGLLQVFHSSMGWLMKTRMLLWMILWVCQKYNAIDGQHELGYKDERVNEPLVDEDMHVFGDDSLGVLKGNAVDGKHQLGYENEKESETLVENNDQLLLEDGDGVLDSEGGVHALRKEVIAIKVDDERIANLERLLKENLQNYFATEKTKPNMIPNDFDDIPNCSVLYVTSNYTGVDQGLGGSTNDPMSTCSQPDMHNAEVTYDGMSIDKPDRKNKYTYSQGIPVTLDVLIQACAYSNKNPELYVFQHDNYVDRSVPKLNQHPTAEPLLVDYFTNDYMSVLNDEEMMQNYSLDDMKFQHEEDNLTVKETPVEHQPIDELIDGQKDTTSLLQENIKKKKKCGIRKNYVVRFKEIKKRLAMALDSPFGQQGTATLALPKTRSISSIIDTIVALEF
nr:hypothetical protein [Tanacetum cinerariifolium]